MGAVTPETNKQTKDINFQTEPVDVTNIYVQQTAV